MLTACAIVEMSHSRREAAHCSVRFAHHHRPTFRSTSMPSSAPRSHLRRHHRRVARRPPRSQPARRRLRRRAHWSHRRQWHRQVHPAARHRRRSRPHQRGRAPHRNDRLSATGSRVAPGPDRERSARCHRPTSGAAGHRIRHRQRARLRDGRQRLGTSKSAPRRCSTPSGWTISSLIDPPPRSPEAS